MRILHVSLDYPPRRTRYGSGTVIDDLLRAQQAAGHEVAVLTPGRVERQPVDGSAMRVIEVPVELTHRYIASLDQTGNMFVAPSGAARWNHDASTWFRATRPFGTWRPDVVHNDGWATQLVAEAAADVSDCALVTTAHVVDRHYIAIAGLGPEAGEDDVRDAETRCFANSDLIVVPSATARDLVQHYFPTHDHRLRIVPHGLDWPIVDAAAGSRPAQQADRVTAVYVGRLSGERAWEPFLASFVAAADQQPRLALKVVGDGPGFDNASGWASPTVDFRGGLPRELAIGEIASADIFCNPALIETFGVAELEALGLGRCVVSNTGFARHTHVEHGVTGIQIPLRGTAVEPELDAGAWTSWLVDLANDPQLRHRLGDEAKRAVRADHDIVRMADDLDAVYDEAVKTASTRDERWRK